MSIVYFLYHFKLLYIFEPIPNRIKMLENIWANVEYGIHHILNINAYDHILFLIVLTVPYAFKDWKRVFLLITMFALGHTLSLILAIYNIIYVKVSLIQFLIPIIILVIAVFNVFTAGKGPQKGKVGVLFLSALFFGLLHGFAFVREFNAMLANTSHHKLVVILELALGIEIAQIIMAFIILFLGYLAQTLFRFSRRDWVMVLSSVVIGFIIPIIFKNNYFM